MLFRSRGAWLELDEADIRALMKAAGVERSERSGPPPARGNRRGRGRPDRAGQGPRTGQRQGPGGGGAAAAGGGGKASGRGAGKGAGQGGGQPDPMRTSLGYIGADSFSRNKQSQARGSRRSGGRSR